MEKYLFLHLSRLGDMIQSLPAVKLLKKQKPDCQITYLGYKDFCPLLRDLPEIDLLVELPSQEAEKFADNNFNKTDLELLKQNYPELNEPYDYVINMTHNKASSYLVSVVRARHISGRIFSNNDEIMVNGKWAKYLVSVVHLRKYNQLNLADIYMGMTGIKNESVYNFLPVKKDTETIYHLKELGYSQEKRAIGFQLGASNEKRMWPLEYFADLGNRLIADGMQIIIFGSAMEKTLSESFARLATFSYIDLVGKTPLDKLPSYLDAIDILVTNDTGTMHIAAAIDKKVVGIFTGIAYFSMTGPYGKGHVAIQSQLPCSPCVDSTSCANPTCRKGITPDAVELGVKIALGNDYSNLDKDYGAGIYVSSFSALGTMIYKPVNFPSSSFFAHLRQTDYIKSSVNQYLWNTWLGLSNEDFLPELPASQWDVETLREMQNLCGLYHAKYNKALKLCQSIITEFSMKKPRLEKLTGYIDEIKKIEEMHVSINSLRILNNIQELYIAETPVCDFPKLANHLSSVYSTMLQIIKIFNRKLEYLL